MKKIDWYIFKKFLGTFFYAIMIFTVISVVIDVTEKIDDFIEGHLTVSYIISHYYIGFIPHIVALLFPLFIFIAVIFFTSKMAYRSEIIAILSSGVSFPRFLRAYWIGGALLAGLLAFANQWVVPQANRIKTQFEDQYIDSHSSNKIFSNIHVRADSSSYITMRTYYPVNRNASGFTLEKIDGQDLLFKLEAQTLRWDSAAGLWKTGRVVMRQTDGMHQRVWSATDTTLKLNITPDDLLNNSNAKEAMTTSQLNKYIQDQQLRGAEGLNYLYVEKYRRVASAFAVIILTFIGVIIASRKVRGGSGLHLALGIVISSAYIVFLQFSTTFSVKGNLNPLIAVWIPNVVFAAVAFWLYRRAPK